MTQTSTPTTADHPGVLVRPPFLYAGAVLVVLGLRWLWPLRLFEHAGALWPGIGLLLLSVAFGIWGRRTMDHAGTNVNPSRPATTIVTSGPFRWTRNPLYVALTGAYLGLTLALDTWWGLVVLVPLLLLMHLGVVRREERYLEHKFGDRYREYRSQVRRYF